MIYFTVQRPKDKHRLMDIPWHLGDPIPGAVFEQKVLKIQADGDELEYLLDCLKPKVITDLVQSPEAVAQAAKTNERDRHADCKAIEAEAWKRVKEYREQRDELANALELLLSQITAAIQSAERSKREADPADFDLSIEYDSRLAALRGIQRSEAYAALRAAGRLL